MKKALLVMIIALCFLSSAALAQEESRCGIVPEGYVCEEGNGFVAAYNPGDIESLFGLMPVPSTASEAHSRQLMENDGFVNLFYRNRELGRLYGNIVVDVNTKKITIINGGILYKQAEEPDIEESLNEGNEQSNPSAETNMSAEKIEIDASRLPYMVATAVSGKYSQNSFSIICAEKCRLTMNGDPVLTTLNITGNAVIIKSAHLRDFRDGRSINRLDFANISGMSSLYIIAGDIIHLSAFADGTAKMDDTEIASENSFYIWRSQNFMEEGKYYDSVKPSGNMRIAISTAGNVGVYSPSEGIMDISLKPHSRSTSDLLSSYFPAGTLKLKLEKGSIFFAESEDLGNAAPEFTSWAFIGNGKIRLMPYVSEGENRIIVIYPRDTAFNSINELALERFNDDDSRVFIEKEGVPARLVFSRTDIQVEDGNWFDIGTSFSSYVYDVPVNNYNKFECDVVLRECFLDGVKVSGFEERAHNLCHSDSDCSETQVCGCAAENAEECPIGICTQKATCYAISEVNPSVHTQNPVKFLIIPDGYSGRQDFIEDVKAALDIELSDDYTTSQ